ncbi:hypothetical protein PLESTB_000167700 [Pleodorina starrii]|uniref:Uncharacterized protein n=1 Tax=Pleodorina starrii TaxID=330485 RepID=A0A9W6BBE4_9CHLO|nr:hypothetical protein PLESTB_000167700 [Pleodorina starrii]
MYLRQRTIICTNENARKENAAPFLHVTQGEARRLQTRIYIQYVLVDVKKLHLQSALVLVSSLLSRGRPAQRQTVQQQAARPAAKGHKTKHATSNYASLYYVPPLPQICR